VATLALISACSTPAPPYQPSISNVETLKRSSGPVTVGVFAVKPGMPNANAVGLRAASMVSPVGADYAAYLGDAIRQELELAGKLSPKSNIEVSGVLTRNEINAGGLSTNDGVLEALFTVKKDGAVRYNKAKRADASWESSFVGAIAIPKAQQQYPLLVQSLLGQLIGDAEFQAAVK
jgi:hypothetical protein